MRLRDKVAVVTGAAQGIGRAIAACFLNEGAAVAIADVDADKARETAAALGGAGRQTLPVFVDTKEPASVQDMARTVGRSWEKIDILVNNAALFTSLTRKPFWQISPEEWDEVLAVNLKGPFLCAQAVLPYMRPQGRGKIINIATVGIFSADNQLMHYNSSKMGLIGLTRTLARELGEFGICVNAVAPGATASENVRRVSSEDRLLAKAASRCLRRIETPDDITGTVLFLASTDADFVTGQLVVVDGGAFFN